jgi:protein phosphatase
MGGHAGGETASRVACEAVQHELRAARDRPGSPFASETTFDSNALAEALRAAIQGACAAVYRASLANPELQGMGTTLVALLVRGNASLVGHVGDSRAYLVRDGEVGQLTEDHSLVNEQVRAGLLSADEARYSRLRNIITRSVGFEEDVAVDLVGLESRKGDRFVLCSDGLSNLVEAEEIGGVLLQAASPDAACNELVSIANDRGGDDNITVVVAERTE